MREVAATNDTRCQHLRERLDELGAGPLDALAWLPETDSTNTRLLAAHCPQTASVLIADQQTAGRGRLGRTWASSADNALLLSVALPLRRGLATAQSLSLAVGVVLVDVLHQAGLTMIGLKWPNDLVVGEHKLGGVLIELSSAAQPFVVIGVGINWCDAPTLDRPTIDLAGLGFDCQRQDQRIDLMARFVNALLSLDESWLRADRQQRQQVLDRWQVLDAYRRCDIELLVGDRVLSGRMLGIDTQGALQIAHPSSDEDDVCRIATYHSGEIRLRSAR
jgi:BirA family biotin operon repressor/biotin-[acetyl-CoA-carboxylase] ligase